MESLHECGQAVVALAIGQDRSENGIDAAHRPMGEGSMDPTLDFDLIGFPRMQKANLSPRAIPATPGQ